MTQANPYEICAWCERFFPRSTLATRWVKNADGVPTPLRICQSCLNPRLTYIAGRSRTISSDAGRLVTATLAIIIAILNGIFGIQIGGAYGLGIILAGVLVGSGILASAAAAAK